MSKGDWNRAHMLANMLYRVGTGHPIPGDNDRIASMYAWLERTGRQDIITEAERLCNRRENGRGK